MTSCSLQNVWCLLLQYLQLRGRYHNLQHSHVSGVLPLQVSWTSFASFFLNQACQILHNEHKMMQKTPVSHSPCAVAGYPVLLHPPCCGIPPVLPPHLPAALQRSSADQTYRMRLVMVCETMSLYNPWFARKGGWASSCQNQSSNQHIGHLHRRRHCKVCLHPVPA